ncbi:MAG: efflux RND transporter periplasmic adaptor subunit [Planctomycetes bacterium]|nr:efflux RND transporter periplasmic adaptor subunit [Planctomycetota bacterium]
MASSEPLDPSNRVPAASGGNPISTGRAPRPAGRTVSIRVAPWALALLIGIAIGARWHESFPWLGGGSGAEASRQKQIWTCGMHPDIRQDHPGSCPICGMALAPIKAQPDGKGVKIDPVEIDPVMVQNIGVRLARVEQGPLARSIRAVGSIDEMESNRYDVNLRVSGWIERLYADTDGMMIARGEPLFDLYSPELVVGAQELAAAARALATAAGESPERRAAQALHAAATAKLLNWGVDQEQIDRLAAAPAPPRTVTFFSPISGHVTERMVQAGSAVKAGERVLRLVDHSAVWLDARVPEADIGKVRVGAKVTATVPAAPGTEFTGEVALIHPHLDHMVRTALVRARIDNRALLLRHAMYATAHIESPPVEDARIIPREAVLDTGARQLVFVALGEGKFDPRDVVIGAEGDGGRVQVLSGLATGEMVVASGQFLIDAESRTREATRKFQAGKAVTEPAGGASGGEHRHGGGGPTSGDGAPAPAAFFPAPTPAPSRPLTLEPGPKPGADSPSGSAAGAPPRAMAPGGNEARPAWESSGEAALASYLDLAEALGRSSPEETKFDGASMTRAAAELRAAAGEGESRVATATALAKAAEVFSAAPAGEQREAFKALSAAAIALADALIPATLPAKQVHVLNCPMAPGDWLQRGIEVANPYYGSRMKSCGKVVRSISGW